MAATDEIVNSEFWQDRWKNKLTGWHETSGNLHLQKHWEAVLAGRDASKMKVFVPLCGKSYDMIWFYEMGCTVVGVELIEAGLQEFIDENGLDMKKESCIVDDKTIPVYKSKDDRIRLYACNLFDLEKTGERDFDIIWDRGSFVAINLSERSSYVELMHRLCVPTATYLHESFEYDPAKHGGVPKSCTDDELKKCYDGHFDMKCLEYYDFTDQKKFGETDWVYIRVVFMTPKKI